jgi:hypothetical protein
MIEAAESLLRGAGFARLDLPRAADFLRAVAALARELPRARRMIAV